MKKIALILVLLMIFSTTSYGDVRVNSNGQLFIDEMEYTDLKEGSFTFGTNLWHTRFLEQPVKFPITEVWQTPPLDMKLGSNSSGQPLILDDVVIATSGDYIYVIDIKTGEIIKPSDDSDELGLRIQWGNSKNKSLYSSPLYISNEDGWFDNDKLSRIFIGTRLDGRMYCYKLSKDNKLQYEWHYETNIKDIIDDPNHAGIVSSPTLLFDRNPETIYGENTVYIAFGNESGYFYILDARNGNHINNGEIKVDKNLSSSPISYVYDKKDLPDTFSSVALGVNGGDNIGNGYIYGGYVENYKFIQDQFLEKEEYEKLTTSAGIPTSISNLEYYNSNNKLEYVFVYTDKKGNIYGYNENVKSESGEPVPRNKLLFKIDKYNGFSSYNTPTIIEDKYAIFTLNKNGKAKVVCIDVLEAIREGNINAANGRLANNAVRWETDNNDFGGPAYVGATAINISEIVQDIKGMEIEYDSGTIVLVGDEGKNKSKSNLKAYYIRYKKQGSNNPQKVNNAFVYKDKDGNMQSSYGIHLDGGVKSEPAFANGVLVVLDGKGVLHAFTYEKQNNLAVVNFENSHPVVERGKRYEAIADIANYSGKEIDEVEVRYTLGGTASHTELIKPMPIDGTTLHLKYTVPKNFDKDELEIEIIINPNKTIEETTYEDNIAYLKVPVAKEIDLAVTKIEYTKYHPGISGTVNIYAKNNSDKPLANVPVKVTIAGNVTDTELINIMPNDTSIATFKLTAPNKTTTFTIKGEVNHTRVYEETTYSNNVKTITAEVKKLEPPTDCISKITWTEPRFSHYKTHKEVWYDKEGKKHVKTWKEAVYKKVSFYSKLDAEAKVDQATIKSGYGIELEVNTSLSHNYDKAYKLTGAQRVYAYFPDLDYPIELEPQNSISNFSNTWILPKNPDSVLKERRHYIPVEWPDGNYPITIKAFDAASPGGKPCKIIKLNVTVKGDMYEDDNTN